MRPNPGAEARCRWLRSPVACAPPAGADLDHTPGEVRGARVRGKRARARPARAAQRAPHSTSRRARERTERKAHGTRTELCFRRNAAKQRRPKPKVKMSSAIRKHRRAETRETRVFAATSA